jgi:hypothetical protein
MGRALLPQLATLAPVVFNVLLPPFMFIEYRTQTPLFRDLYNVQYTVPSILQRYRAQRSGSQRDVYLGGPIVPTYMSPNAAVGVAGTQPMSTAVHMEPQKNFGDLTPY